MLIHSRIAGSPCVNIHAAAIAQRVAYDTTCDLQITATLSVQLYDERRKLADHEVRSHRPRSSTDTLAARLRLVARAGEARAAADHLLLLRLQPDPVHALDDAGRVRHSVHQFLRRVARRAAGRQ